MRASPIRIVTAAIAVAGLAASAQAGPRAVVELFTSQGCPSCPPADALLTKLARDPDLIALSLPVDYFDQPGLKEKLSRHAFTERQEAYANARGDDDLYTPQAIVNGREQAFGSERQEIEDAAAATASNLRVPVEIVRGSDGIVVSVGAAASKGSAQGKVVLLPYVAARDVAAGRGTRHKMTFTKVVGDILVLGAWAGAPMSQTVPADALKDYDGVAVLLQQGSVAKPGAILGAASASLR